MLSELCYEAWENNKLKANWDFMSNTNGWADNWWKNFGKGGPNVLRCSKWDLQILNIISATFVLISL